MLANPAEIQLLLQALTDRAEVSWERAWATWAPRVAVWVHRHPQFHQTGEEAQYFVSRALEKLWRAVDEEKLARFETPAQVLQYLKLCVHSSILEWFRRPPSPDLIYLDEDDTGREFPDTEARVEPSVVEQLDRNELWRIVTEHARTEHDKVLVEAALVRGLPPRLIAQRYQGFFPDVQDVYRMKRNLLERLGRDPRLRSFL